MSNLGSPYKSGYKWSDGTPMSDFVHDMLVDFYEYAKSNGDTCSKEDFLKFFETEIHKGDVDDTKRRDGM